MGDQSDQPRWLVKLHGSARDIEAVKRNYSASSLAIEDIGDERFLSAPLFASCNSASEVMVEAAGLFANLNVAMSITERHYSGLGVGQVAERTAKGLSRTGLALAQSGRISISGMVPTAYVTGPDGQILPAGPPPRSYAERLIDLIGRDDDVRGGALALAAQPVSWGNLYIAFETVERVLAQEGKRLGDTGWISNTEAKQFKSTADYYRHGHPRRPIPPGREISPDDGAKLVKRLFRHWVDRLQPN